MNDLEYYKEQAEHYKKKLESYVENQKQEKKNNALMGKILMAIFGFLIAYSFFPWAQIEDTGVHLGLSFSGLIWGFAMWFNGKNKTNL
ncbi:TPA: hypothetical protein JBL19_06325 [Legionella pneumophila]|nr:hypothetical protein [Legionella pneumophila subsp. fraseri]HAT1796323.1 hypothetical protein [Legionella pneumophila]MDW8961465.1 hypothetical protein [Legionella pneumophila subsp. fraseri]MDW9036258.1 hypothetical protein [Legionella pneumophila subsp. fraseri]MDW9038985.1 hypothetical protein [Legionella pneumophila subsp. fraseri]